MKISRDVAPPLRPFIRKVWVLDADGAESTGRERVLPTGLMHLAFRLSGAPFTFFPDPAAARCETVGLDVIGGPRSSSYVKQLSPGRSIGMQFEAGAASLVFGVPAHELAERHTSLADLWGAEASELRERLASIEDPRALIEALERFLLARLPRVHGVDPAIAFALDRFRRSVPVSQVVDQIGWSHRRFIQRFRETVGMTPKRFCRVRRLAHVLRLAERKPAASLAELALDAGYSDQPHFNREFRELTDMAPGEYRAAAPAAPHHVKFVQD
ncbi:MAG TPA: helix-turn-helix transcriptional regulator [Thermoanaerobaculia bacterium]